MIQKLCLVIILATTSVFRVSSSMNSIDKHLEEYAEYNQTHHDNIDDEPHAHTHKHGEGEEEHEHQHNHEFNIVQVDVYLLGQGDEIAVLSKEIDQDEGQVVKNLVSSAHPSELFRPPIC